MQDAQLDIQIELDNRPLTYYEDDVKMPALTLMMVSFGKVNYFPDNEPSNIQNRVLVRRTEYPRKCNDAIWKGWKSQYLGALRKRHTATHSGKQAHEKIDDIVFIKGKGKYRALWRIGKIIHFILRSDNVVRVVRLRGIQFPYSLELHGSGFKEIQNGK